VKNPAGRGGRWVEIAPERLPRWVDSFAERHDGAPEVVTDGSVLTLTAPDGSVAALHPPFPPVPGLRASSGAVETIAAHALRPRTVGVLLVRLGGYAAGVFTGSPPRLTESKTGSRNVHGRSAAGGWSQHRFARRREKQVSESLKSATDAALAVFGAVPALDAVVLGGDKRTMAPLRDDPRLAPYLELATDRFLTVPDPRRAVLEATPAAFTAIRAWLPNPPPP
jgi:Actinobacteria/chloroflexi VLRF1 release factor